MHMIVATLVTFLWTELRKNGKFKQTTVHVCLTHEAHTLYYTILVYLFTNYHSKSIHYGHFSTTPQDSSFLRQHRHQLTVTIHAYDSNFCFDIWRVTNADYLLTYLLT